MREDLKLRIKWGSAVISVSTPWIMKIRVNSGCGKCAESINKMFVY
jgi:hypothetical protein